MNHYVDAATFLDTLAAAIDAGMYRKANFPDALDAGGWSQLIADLYESSELVKSIHIAPFQSIGILPFGSAAGHYTHAQLSQGIKKRLDLVAFTREHVQGFLAPKH